MTYMHIITAAIFAIALTPVAVKGIENAAFIAASHEVGYER
jgi:hypothetical protein